MNNFTQLHFILNYNKQKVLSKSEFLYRISVFFYTFLPEERCIITSITIVLILWSLFPVCRNLCNEIGNGKLISNLDLEMSGVAVSLCLQ
jgi:hypothetical protein